MRKTISVFAAIAVAGLLLSLMACGSYNGQNQASITSSGTTSPLTVTGGDAPLSSVLSAMVTLSAVTFTDNKGNTFQVLAQPRTVELTQLGGIRTPLELSQLPKGTYTNVSVTVSGAVITYPGATAKAAASTAKAKIASPTASIQLNPNFVADGNAIDLRFDFDLADSIDLTNGVVTFTPDISAAIARVQDEGNNDRLIVVNGLVTAVNTSKSTITLQPTDTQVVVTLDVDQNTVFNNSLTLAGIQVGAALKTEDELSPNGSITALTIDAANNGATVAPGARVDSGIITGSLLENNQLMNFTLFIRSSTNAANVGQTITVNVTPNTAYNITTEATNAGMPSFDQTQVIAGAGLQVSSTGATSNATTVTATQIQPSTVSPHGLVDGQVTTTSNGLSIPMLFDANGNFSLYSGIVEQDVNTNANTIFDGTNLTAASAPNLGLGTPLVYTCFVGMDMNTFNYVLYAATVHEEAH